MSYTTSSRHSLVLHSTSRSVYPAETEHRFVQSYALILKVVLVTSMVKTFRLRRTLLRLHAVLSSVLSIIQTEQSKHKQEALLQQSVQEDHILTPTPSQPTSPITSNSRLTPNNTTSSSTNSTSTTKTSTKTINFVTNPRDYSLQTIASACDECSSQIKTSLLDIIERFPIYRRQLEALFQRNLQVCDQKSQLSITISQQKSEQISLRELLNELQCENEKLRVGNETLQNENRMLQRGMKKLKQTNMQLNTRINVLRLHQDQFKRRVSQDYLIGNLVLNSHTAHSRISSSAVKSRSSTCSSSNHKNTSTSNNELSSSMSPIALTLAQAYEQQEENNSAVQKLNFQSRAVSDKEEEIQSQSDEVGNGEVEEGEEDEDLLQSLFFKPQINEKKG